MKTEVAFKCCKETFEDIEHLKAHLTEKHPGYDPKKRFKQIPLVSFDLSPNTRTRTESVYEYTTNNGVTFVQIITSSE